MLSLTGFNEKTKTNWKYENTIDIKRVLQNLSEKEYKKSNHTGLKRRNLWYSNDFATSGCDGANNLILGGQQCHVSIKSDNFG